MRLRYWTALLALCGIAVGVGAKWHGQPSDPVTLSDSVSGGLQNGNGWPGATFNNDDLDTGITVADAEVATGADEGESWTRVIGDGDSLSGILADAGLDRDASTEVIMAIGSEYDLRHLKPGHSLALMMSPSGLPQTATLEIDDGTRILATFGATPSVQRVEPSTVSVRRAGEVKIGSSIYAALEAAGIPTRFATDIELILAGALDLRTALEGGEHIRLLWREHRFEGREVGEPTIDFAQLDLTSERYEILWPDDRSRETRIFKNGALVQTFSQPIRGARLSSAFGLRKHPIYGNIRMHSGVDFAAKQGAVVTPTQSGKIAFIGKRSGYGLLIEIEHNDDIRTLYAHLSAVNEALQVGQRVVAGAEVGRVGSTGTSTAPHLHYEIHVDGKPVSPLADTRLGGRDNGSPFDAEPLVLVEGMQSELDRLLPSSG